MPNQFQLLDTNPDLVKKNGSWGKEDGKGVSFNFNPSLGLKKSIKLAFGFLLLVPLLLPGFSFLYSLNKQTVAVNLRQSYDPRSCLSQAKGKFIFSYSYLNRQGTPAIFFPLAFDSSKKPQKNSKTAALSPSYFLPTTVNLKLEDHQNNLKLSRQANEEVPDQSPARKVILGNEKLFTKKFLLKLKDQRLGLVVNQTSRLPDKTPLWEAILNHQLSLTAIFTPEHGLQANIEGGQPVSNNSWQGIPIYSLYGSHYRPTSSQLEQIDILIYDLQDVGTRFYTYITTLKYILEAAAVEGKKVIICDRPNPLGGVITEGPLLQPPYKSFIGALPVPIRYGLTCGELALMMKGEGWIPAAVELEIIPLDGWQRDYLWSDLGLPWIPTSPNIPGFENALLYPGLGLLGGLRINQGLGTDFPFLRVGAPWFNPYLLKKELESDPSSAGLSLRPVDYTPRAIPGKILTPPFKDRVCHGLQIVVEKPQATKPVAFTLNFIRVLKQHYPNKIKPAPQGLNRLFGTDLLLQYLNNRLSFSSLVSKIEEEAKTFDRQRRKYLLYQ